MDKYSRRSFVGIAGTAVAAVYGGTQLLSDGVSKASAAEASLFTPGSGPLRNGPSSPQVSELTPFMDPLQIPPR